MDISKLRPSTNVRVLPRRGLIVQGTKPKQVAKKPAIGGTWNPSDWNGIRQKPR